MKTIGVMLDCSRNAVRNVNSLKEYILTSKKMRCNRLYLYLEDTYEIEGEPYFGYMRGRYSLKELKELNDFGKLNGVELVPCIQTLAHLNQAFRWSTYDQIRDIDDVLMLDEERTYILIDRMFSSLSKVFDTKVFNVGMDEAYRMGLGNYLYKHGHSDKVKLFMNHLSKVNEIAHKYNKNIAIWSDMLYRTATGQFAYYAPATKFDYDFINIIPKDVTVIYWDYYHQDVKTYNDMFKGHKSLNCPVWFASGIWSWAGFTSNNTFAFSVLKPGITSALKNNVDDIIITAWGDDGGECALNSFIPSVFYASELAHGVNKMKDIKAHFFDAFGIKFDDFMKLDLPNLIDLENIHVNPSKYLVYNDPFLGALDSTISGKENAFYAKTYKKLRSVTPKLNEYGYLGKYMSSLCKLLSYKAELGVKTRNAYQNHDKDRLKEILKDYDNSIKYLKQFLESFQNAWFKENKSYGFEIQLVRLGGLSTRLEFCKKELIKYINGEIDSIDELEQPLYSLDGISEEKLSKNPELVNSYIFNSSMCRF